MSRDKAIKAVQRLIRLYLSKHGYHVEQSGQQWQWRRDGTAATPAIDVPGSTSNSSGRFPFLYEGASIKGKFG